MAKLIFHPHKAVSNKLKLGTQYKSLKTWLIISGVLNVSLILILLATTLR